MTLDLKKKRIFMLVSIVTSLFVFGLVLVLSFNYLRPVEYERVNAEATAKDQTAASAVSTVPQFIVQHIKTPTVVKAVYMSSWVAGTKNVREQLLKTIGNTEINSVVIDIKDYSGKIMVKMDNPVLAKYDSYEDRISDVKEFIGELHQKGFYVIGRVAVFQDNYLPRQRPDLAVKRLDNKQIWLDKKSIAWLDPSSQEVWDYTVAIAKTSYSLGFDEINFDYIRFPSDGQVANIYYTHYDAKIKTKADALQDFFVYLHTQLATAGIPISADLFGMVTTNTDDLGIGQVLEKAAPYFDYISPMVYPSHYPPGFHGYKNPASMPYEVVKFCLDSAVVRLEAINLPPTKLRPWLQDFDLGATYTADMVRAEKQAVYDAGLSSWMAWDPANHYTPSAYNRRETTAL